MEWFKSWFNSPYYHILYDHRNKEEAELFIRHLASYLNLEKQAHLLDLACGNGRHAIILNQLGYRVTGIDLSENNIKTAQLKENPTLSFVQGDMRDVYKKEEFDVVLNLFTSFGYFNLMDDNKKVIQSAFQMLKNEGLIVIDYFNTHVICKNLLKKESIQKQHVQFDISKEIVDGFIIKTIHIKDEENNYYETFHEKVMLISPEEIQSLLTHHSFQLLNLFGDYDLNPFQLESSKRLILIARR